MTETKSVTPACCAESHYRRLVSLTTDGPVTRKQERCAVCGRNHYTMIVPPVEMGVTGAEIG